MCIELREDEVARNGRLSRIRSKIEKVFGIISFHLNRSMAKYLGLVAN